MQINFDIKSFRVPVLVVLGLAVGCSSERPSASERIATATNAETTDTIDAVAASAGDISGGFPNPQGVMMGDDGVPVPGQGDVGLPSDTPAAPDPWVVQNDLGDYLRWQPTRTQVYVGERMTKALARASGATLTSLFTITVTGNPVREYTQTPMRAEKLAFVGGEPPLSWHWTRPGTFSATLRWDYTASVTNGPPRAGSLSLTIPITVLPIPFSSRPESEISSVHVEKYTDERNRKICELLLGERNETPGFQSDLFVTSRGTLRWTQLVKMSRIGGNLLNDGTEGPGFPFGNSEYALDAPWDTNGTAMTGYTEDAHLSGFAQFGMDDSPGYMLRPGMYYKIEDKFQTYLMWKSDDAGAIFVPVWRVDWHWKGAAQYSTNGSCTLLPGSEAQIDGEWNAPELELPTWTDNAQRMMRYPDAPPPPSAPPPDDEKTPLPDGNDSAPSDGSTPSASRLSSTRGILVSGLNPNKCLDSDGSNDGTAVHLWDCQVGNTNQAWTFENDGTIRAYGKCLDLKNGDSSNEATIQLFECSPNNPNQQWRLHEDGTIRQSKTGKCVDVFKERDDNGTRVVHYDCNGGANQRWTFEPEPTAVQLFSGLDAGNCLDVSDASSANGTSVIRYWCGNDDNQKWRFYRDGTIRSLGKCLDLSAGNTANGARIQIWDCMDGNANQFWKRDSGQIKHVRSGKCIDLQGGNAVLHDCDGEFTQQWSTSPPAKNTIVTAMAVTHCLDVEGANSANGTPVQLQECMGTGSQDWRLHSDGTIRTLGKCLDLSAGDTADGAKIQLWDCVPNNTNQQWFIESGHVKQVSSGKCATTQTAEATNGNRVVLGVCSNATNNRWTVTSSERYALKSQMDAATCVETQVGSRTNATRVQIGRCNGSSNQDWRFHSDGTVRALGKCVDVSNDGAHLEIWDCVPQGEKQKWSFVGGQIKQDASGKCLDLPGGNIAAGTELIVHDCNGQANQVWLPQKKY